MDLNVEEFASDAGERRWIRKRLFYTESKGMRFE
jgi:hypothetical protein